MGGHVASELWEGEKRFDVTVRLPYDPGQNVRVGVSVIPEASRPVSYNN